MFNLFLWEKVGVYADCIGVHRRKLLIRVSMEGTILNPGNQAPKDGGAIGNLWVHDAPIAAVDSRGDRSSAAKCEAESCQSADKESSGKGESKSIDQKSRKYFYYDPPLQEDTGLWIPVSYPPMLENHREDWTRR